jgi:CelD/BcsL family acetyltransferase involved in cellulose biosynthesis
MLQSPVAVRRITRFEDVGKEAWDELVTRSEYPSVFQSYGWLTSWWNVFREPSDELILIAATHGENLLGIAPLYKSTAGMGRGRHTVRFVGDGHTDYSTIIVDRDRTDVSDRILADMASLARLHVILELLEIPEHTTLAQRLRALTASSQYAVDLSGSTVCPRLPLDRDGDTVAAVLKKDSLKRHTAKLRKLGAVTVEHFTSRDAIVPLLDAFFEQHIARWSVTKFPSLFLKDKNREFYRRMVDAVAPEGHVVFTTIKLNGEPVAFHLGFRSCGEFYWYKPTFDIRLAHVSPGEVLIRELFAFAAAQGFSAFDFLRGDEQFKSRFASSFPRNLSFVLRSHRLERSVRRIGRRAKRWVRQRLIPARFDHVVVGVADDHPDAGVPERAARVGMRLARAIARDAAHWMYFHNRVDVFTAAPWSDAPMSVSQPSTRVIAANLETLLTAPLFASHAQRASVLRLAFQRLRTGDTCYLLLVNDRFAGYGWAATKSQFLVTEVGLGLPFGPGEVVLYDFLILPEWRGRGFYPTLLASIRALNSDARHWIFAERRNRGSVKGILRAGFTFAFPLERTIIFGRSVSTVHAPAFPQLIPQEQPDHA